VKGSENEGKCGCEEHDGEKVDRTQIRSENNKKNEWRRKKTEETKSEPCARHANDVNITRKRKNGGGSAHTVRKKSADHRTSYSRGVDRRHSHHGNKQRTLQPR
jgi:hypothetical protein